MNVSRKTALERFKDITNCGWFNNPMLVKCENKHTQGEHSMGHERQGVQCCT